MSDTDYEPGVSDEVASVCRRFLREALFQINNGDGYDYDHLIADLAAARVAAERELVRAIELKTHRHQWNEEEYCDLCGADGRS